MLELPTQLRSPVLLALASLIHFGTPVSAQVSFYPIKPDPALDGANQMGVQRPLQLRLSGTAIFGSVRDYSISGFEQYGEARWGLDGVLNWEAVGSGTDSYLRDLGEDGDSRIMLQFVGQSERYQATFADGTWIALDATFGFGGGEFVAVSPDGMSIFGTEWSYDYLQSEVYRYRPAQAPLLVHVNPTVFTDRFLPKASDFEGTTLIGRLPNHELGRWTEVGGMQVLMPVAPKTHFSRSPMDISYDGTVVVGRGPSNFPVIWREGQGLQVLDDCPLSSGGQFDLQCSGDGQRIDAWTTLEFVTWNATDGWRTLQQVVEGLGGRDLDSVDEPLRIGERTKDGAAILLNYTDPAAPFLSVRHSVVFLGEPGPGALGSNYCGPARLNSSGFRAIVQATGSASIQANALTMNAQFLPAQACGYVVSSPGTGFVEAPGGSIGNLCLGGGQPIGRHDQAGEICVANGDGVIEFPIDLQSLPSPTAAYAALPGETLSFQVWFRDTDPNGTPSSNFTDAVSVTFE